MNYRGMETLGQGEDSRECHDGHRTRIPVLALTAIATLVWMVQAVPINGTSSEAPSGLATVRRDGVRLYKEMAAGSKTVKILKRGDVVTVSFALTTTDGAWCHVVAGPGAGGEGYVRCEDLDREPPPRWRETPIESPAAPPAGRTEMSSPTDGAGEALLRAASKGDTVTVRALLAQGVDQITKDGAMRSATVRGHTNTVKALLAGGAYVGSKDINNQTPLYLASNSGDVATVQALLAAGADVNARTIWGGTALMGAALWGHTDTVQALLASGADVNARDKKGQTALIVAASYAGRAHTPGKKSSHPATIQSLMASGADVNAREENGRTALMLAAANGHIATIQALLAAGADVNARDKYAGTALREASEGRHSSVIRLLKQAGAQE